MSHKLRSHLPLNTRAKASCILTFPPPPLLFISILVYLHAYLFQSPNIVAKTLNFQQSLRLHANSGPMSSKPPKPIHLDGTTLEGGGHLLRLAVSLSSLTQIPILVTDIRGKRPGKVSGLKASHLAGVTWLASATAAMTEGMEVKSKRLVFKPSNTGASITSRGQGEHLTRTVDEKEGVWEDIFDGNELVRRQSRIPMSSPGSICLVLQAILPYLPFSNCSNPQGQKFVVPLRVTIEGGTNVSCSPSIEYVSQVLLPVLCQK